MHEIKSNTPATMVPKMSVNNAVVWSPSHSVLFTVKSAWKAVSGSFATS